MTLQAKGVSLVYDDHGRSMYACRDVDLEVRKGEFLGILGPSGSGKSSLLYMLSGLKVPTGGAVEFMDRPLSALNDDRRSLVRRQEFGFVFQQPFLLGYLSAIENVLVAGGTEAEASTLLASLGLLDKAHRQPHELSGGERQRVCVARALANQPKVVFADEPTAALDHANGVNVVTLLNRLRGDGSLVMVTHDETMLAEADRIVRIVDGRVAD
ncbi:ABC transporter ATP-binding protein [bacterium]|nr:MAG: ABC transporter ATP-binding protein [bacterium]